MAEVIVGSLYHSSHFSH